MDFKTLTEAAKAPFVAMHRGYLEHQEKKYCHK